MRIHTDEKGQVGKNQLVYAALSWFSCRPHDYSSEGFNDWAFMTTHSWDESPTGAWMLEIENVAGASDYGKASSGVDFPARFCAPN